MTWPQIQVLIAGAIIGAIVQYLVFLAQRKRLREEGAPEQLNGLVIEVGECQRRLDEIDDEKKQERKDDVGIRERLRYLEAKINGVHWKGREQ